MKNANLAKQNFKSSEAPFDEFYKSQLFQFTSQNTHSIKDLIDHKAVKFYEDSYGNTKTIGLKSFKTENKINLLKFFKPGDLLSNIVSQK